MNKIIFSILILISVNCLSQEVSEFKLTENGLNGYVVNTVSDNSAESLYNNVDNWSKKSLYNPKYSKKASIENDYLRFKIRLLNALQWHGRHDVTILLETRFKENKIRYDISIIDISGGNVNIKYDWIGWSLFKKDGTQTNSAKKATEELNAEFNLLIEEITSFVKKEKNDW